MKEENQRKNNKYPGKPITKSERDLYITKYKNKEYSDEEEEEFHKKETHSYFGRLDADVKYNKKMYYNKFYITKDKAIEKYEKGIIDPKTGVYILPNELRMMGKEGLITVEEVEKGIIKEYGDGAYLVYWATPIANFYYDKENTNMKINEYTYNLMLKREFSFDPFKYNNTYIDGDALYREGTADEFLLEMLLKKKNDIELTNIISTIQSNQNKIIRANSNENFIVQGCAGSGKTVILLHRLSYLKFNSLLPDYDKVKIITPSQLFENFIKNLTNELSIDAIEQITIENYYYELNSMYIERYNKLEGISANYYIKHKNRFEKEFDLEKMYNEYEILEKNAIDIYSEQMLDMIDKEYKGIISAFDMQLEKYNMRIDNNFSNNQIYYEQIIRKIEKTIDTLQNNTEKYEYSNIQRDIKSADSLINRINEAISNNDNILENKKNLLVRLENEINNITDKKIVLKSKPENVQKNRRIINIDHDITKKMQQKVLNNQEKVLILDNKIKELEKLHSKLGQEIIENDLSIKEVDGKCDIIKKKIQDRITQGKGFIEKMRNTAILSQYYTDLKIESAKRQQLYERCNELIRKRDDIAKQIEEFVKEKDKNYAKMREHINNRPPLLLKPLKKDTLIRKYDEITVTINEIYLRQIKLLEELKLREQKRDNLVKQLQDCNNKKEKVQEEIKKLQDLITQIVENVYFSIEIYKKIINKIKEHFLFPIVGNKFSKIDMVVFLYINYLHIGELINSDKLLCIDEAQDYSEIEIELLKKVNKNVIVNLYGDINQSIYRNGIRDWSYLCDNLNLKKYVLNENYRNSFEITKYCNEQFGYSVMCMGSPIKSVEIIDEERIDEIIEQKINLQQNVAIISKTGIKNRRNNRNVFYRNIQETKGIEYNTVIVYDEDLNSNEKYIAYTRALLELYIVRSKKCQIGTAFFDVT